MSLDKDLKEMQIYMSETSDFTFAEKNKISSLTANSVRGAREIAYTQINRYEACMTDGAYDSPDPNAKYVAYTFFIKNCGDESTRINYKLILSNVEKEIHKGVRVMMTVLTDPDRRRLEFETAGKEQGAKDLLEYTSIYMYEDDIEKKPYKPDAVYDEFYYPDNYPDYPHQCVRKFKDDRTVFDEESKTLSGGDKLMFTLFIWLEGDDPDTVNTMLGGKIKIRMNFSASENSEEGE